MSNKLNLEIPQGTTFKRTITMKDTTGLPVNFTGTQLRGAIKETAQDTVPLATFTTTMLNVNTWEIKLTDTQTNSLNFVKGVYDIEIVWANTDVDRILQGNVVLSKGVTT